VRRVCVVITARPSYSRVKTVLDALKGRVELQIVAAASALVTRYGRVVDQIRADGHEVTVEVPCVVDGGGTRESAISTGLLTTQLATVFAGLRPDVVVTIADRHETLATAIAASYQHIPLCHIQGGEVSGSIDDKVRNSISQLADIHCVATQGAGMALETMRVPGRIYRTGCPSIDLAAEALRLGPLPGADVVVLQHPVTNEADQAGVQMRETIEALRGMDVMWFWPGEDAGGEVMCKELRLAGFHPIRNKPPIEFLRILLGSGCLVGNSSVGIRECSFLGVPVVDIGTRQAGRERGVNARHAGYSSREIEAAVKWFDKSYAPTPGKLYGDGHSGERIANILMGKAEEKAA
jgi:UDP-hydrolysing UDP-N-acetyl-D-glucosamine 2-epimerase